MSRFGASHPYGVALPGGSQRELEALARQYEYQTHGPYMSTIIKGRDVVPQGKPYDHGRPDASRWVNVARDVTGTAPAAKWQALAKQRLENYSQMATSIPSVGAGDAVLRNPQRYSTHSGPGPSTSHYESRTDSASGAVPSHAYRGGKVFAPVHHSHAPAPSPAPAPAPAPAPSAPPRSTEVVPYKAPAAQAPPPAPAPVHAALEDAKPNPKPPRRNLLMDAVHEVGKFLAPPPKDDQAGAPPPLTIQDALGALSALSDLAMPKKPGGSKVLALENKPAAAKTKTTMSSNGKYRMPRLGGRGYCDQDEESEGADLEGGHMTMDEIYAAEREAQLAAAAGAAPSAPTPAGQKPAAPSTSTSASQPSLRLPTAAELQAMKEAIEATHAGVKRARDAASKGSSWLERIAAFLGPDGTLSKQAKEAAAKSGAKPKPTPKPKHTESEAPAASSSSGDEKPPSVAPSYMLPNVRKAWARLDEEKRRSLMKLYAAGSHGTKHVRGSALWHSQIEDIVRGYRGSGMGAGMGAGEGDEPESETEVDDPFGGGALFQEHDADAPAPRKRRRPVHPDSSAARRARLVSHLYHNPPDGAVFKSAIDASRHIKEHGLTW